MDSREKIGSMIPRGNSTTRKFWVLILVFLAALITFTVFGGRGLWQIYLLKVERDRILASNALLNEENRKLAEQIARLRNDKKEIEKIVREELGLVRKGEIIYQFEK